MILVDGRCCDVVSALDRGLAYGDGIFRTMRVKQGTIPLWAAHYAKLQRDCARLALACPAQAELCADFERLLGDRPDCVLKIIVTRGAAGRGYGGFDALQPSRIVVRSPLPVQRSEYAAHGICARWCRIRLARQPALAGVKHLNRLENVLARREWEQDDVAEGLLCDTQENVVGGTMTNIFVLEQDSLVTPPLDACGVEGVQRERLLALAPKLGMACRVEPLSPARVLACEQVYLVNSVIGLWWVSALGERRWSRAARTLLLHDAVRADDG